MCNTNKCKYENEQGNCTVPVIDEDSLCYHPKVDALNIKASFDISLYMFERGELYERQRFICDQIMVMHDRNTVEGLERRQASYKKQRQALLDKIALQHTIDDVVHKVQNASWEPLEADEEKVQRISNILKHAQGKRTCPNCHQEVEELVGPGIGMCFGIPVCANCVPVELPTKAEIDALGWGNSKVSRVKAVRHLSGLTLGLKEALDYVNELYYQDE